MSKGHSEPLPAGSKVWAKSNGSWVKATVAGVTDSEVCLEAEGGQTLTCQPGDCFLQNMDCDQVEDMTALAHLHEPGVLWNLAVRYSSNSIYTYTGSILLAVNPFASLPGLYGPETMQQYSRSMDLRELPPHVFAVAAAAYKKMMAEKKGQALLVTGESGAGKTETSKLIMRFLAHCGGHHRAGEGHDVERKVLESNPLLEAFGNAKTVRNDNSSRFGKYVELHFDAAGSITGAAVRTFLLEKCRVVGLSDPERNYHVFYQLCDGASEEERQRWRLLPASEFRFLNRSSCFNLKGVDNAEEYQHTRRAMTCIGLTAEEQDNAFQVVAALLHLGNVSFTDTSAEGGHDAAEATADTLHHLESAGQLLGVDAGHLQRVLVTRNRNTMEGVIVSTLDSKAASTTRDALVMSLYAKLFDWLVAKVNVAVGGDPAACSTIGLLDIYGFESFAMNDFEQLCINLANEKLQQHFNTHVFKWEQAEYEREGIDWSYIEFADNQDVLDLIEGRLGLLDLIDEQCRFPSATSKELAAKLTGSQSLLDSPRFAVNKRAGGAFSIQHYAGDVPYQVTNLLDKNRDYAVAEHTLLLGASTVPLVALLMGLQGLQAEGQANGHHTPNGKSGSPNGTPNGKNGARGGGNAYQFVSVGSQFRKQLGELMAVLQRMEPHYVRCVKPNAAATPLQLDGSYALQQLKCGGVMEAVRISCAGFPYRRPFAVFLDNFWQLQPPSGRSPTMADRDRVSELLRVTSIDGYQLGTTKVFLKGGAIATLERHRVMLMAAAASKIQHAWRGYLAARSYQRLLAVVKGCAARHELRRRRRHCAAVAIQAQFRCWSVRRAFVRSRAAATQLQAQWRGCRARRAFRQIRLERAATAVQAAWRCREARRRLMESRRERAAVMIQRCWRGYMAWATFQLQRMAVGIIQRAWRRKRARKQFFGSFLDNCRRHVAASTIQLAWKSNRRSERLRECLRRAFRDFIAKHGAAIVMQRAYRCKAAVRKLSKQRLASRVQMWAARVAAASTPQPMHRSPPAKQTSARVHHWPTVPTLDRSGSKNASSTTSTTTSPTKPSPSAQPRSWPTVPTLDRSGSKNASSTTSATTSPTKPSPSQAPPHMPRQGSCATEDVFEGSAKLPETQYLSSNLSEPELSGMPCGSGSGSASPDGAPGGVSLGLGRLSRSTSDAAGGGDAGSLGRLGGSLQSDGSKGESFWETLGGMVPGSPRGSVEDAEAGAPQRPPPPSFNIASVRGFWLQQQQQQAVAAAGLPPRLSPRKSM